MRMLWGYHADFNTMQQTQVTPCKKKRELDLEIWLEVDYGIGAEEKQIHRYGQLRFSLENKPTKWK